MAKQNTEKGFALESELVRKLGTMHISGDIIPPQFFDVIRFPATDKTASKPDLSAILILSNLIYWFRPIRPEDPQTGKPLAWRQRFKGEWLERDLMFWVEKFGLTKRQVKDACARLKKSDWVDSKQKPKTLGGSNILFKPNIEKIYFTLFPESRETFERLSEKAERRLNVSRETFERPSSFLIHKINNIDYRSSSNGGEIGIAAAAAKNPRGEHASKHDFGTVFAFVEATRQTAKNPKGLAKTIWRSGEDDNLIDDWLMRTSGNKYPENLPDNFFQEFSGMADGARKEMILEARKIFNTELESSGKQALPLYRSIDELDRDTRLNIYKRVYWLFYSERLAA